MKTSSFFWRTLAPMSLALALRSIPVLGHERVCLRKGCPWPRASNLVSSTPPLSGTAIFAGRSLILPAFSEVESRTQGSRPRPRTPKKSEAKAKDSLSEDRPSRGPDRNAQAEGKVKNQGHKRKCSPKKKSLHKNFSGDLQKKKWSSRKFFRRSPQKHVFQKIFHTLHKILTIQKILLSSSRGQANFRGLEASRPRPRT